MPNIYKFLTLTKVYYMVVVTLRLSNNVNKRVEELVKSGEFESKADVIRTALIEWLSWREMKTSIKGGHMRVYKKERQVK